MSAEKSYKEVSGFITQIVNTCISVLKVFVRSKFGVHLPTAQEETCIVLGNGPSLKKSFENHPDFFTKYSLICVNNFSLTQYYEKLQPKYYVMLDPGYWFGNNQTVIDTINCIQTKTTWEMHLLLPPAAKKSVLLQQLIKKNKNIHPTYFNYTVFKGFKNIAHRFYKKNLAMIQSQNVLVASVFLGINMGYKKVYVFGADHTWHENLHVDENNVLCLKNVHFYENEELIKYTPFYKGVHTKETFRMDEILVTWGKTFYGYVALNEYAVSQNCTIYNASEISFIDAFKRIKL